MSMNKIILTSVLAVVIGCLFRTSIIGATEQWRIFETTFTSSKSYENPVQEVKVRVKFISPQKNERTLLAFWNGANAWRVRFSPDEIGEWTYETACSDPSNQGLHQQTGRFQCVEYQGENLLYQNGELRLSENRRYFQHANGKPFFFLSGTVWCGPALADFNDWQVFLQDRVEKKFTAIQFVVAQWRMFEKDAEGNVTFTGKEKIRINPPYFQRLDRYVDAINEAGLVAVPVVLWALPHGNDNPGHVLPEDQKIVLAEYIVARYGAHQLMWFLGGDGNYENEQAETWKNVGRAVFNADQHRLVSMHPWGKSWVGDEFRQEPWFDFISYQSGHGDDEKTFRWLTEGPPATQWNETPVLPVINVEPNYEAHNGYSQRKVHTDHSVRRAAYWSLLVSPTAGVSYGGQGIWGWHTKVQAPADHVKTGLGSPWQRAKDLPGAFSMQELHEFFQSIEWWRLMPAPELIVNQPGLAEAAKFIAAAKTEDGTTAVIYLPEGMKVKINTRNLNVKKARWYHPRTGGWLEAGETQPPEQEFEPADRNDWVLLLTL